MQKLVLVVFALLAISAFASIPVNIEELKSLWSSWKTYNGKSYSTAEEEARFYIFVDNYKKVIANNAASDNVKLALNGFSDLTATEFKTIYASGFTPKATRPQADTTDYSALDLPASVDWRSHGAVTAVKNQGQCGSCWTFSATGSLEGWHFIKSGVLLSLSEQQIVDCDTSMGGCNGGNTDQALSYAAQNGIELELTYPYTAQNGNCKYSKAVAIQVNNGANSVGVRNSDGVKTALVNQPVSVAIEADQDIFQQYSSGVIGDGCGTNIDHAVLAVGYTSVNGQEAFIIKNSWGSGWGQSGYVYLSTDGSLNGGEGACGVLSDPAVPY